LANLIEDGHGGQWLLVSSQYSVESFGNLS